MRPEGERRPEDSGGGGDHYELQKPRGPAQSVLGGHRSAVREAEEPDTGVDAEGVEQVVEPADEIGDGLDGTGAVTLAEVVDRVDGEHTELAGESSDIGGPHEGGPGSAGEEDERGRVGRAADADEGRAERSRNEAFVRGDGPGFGGEVVEEGEALVARGFGAVREQRGTGHVNLGG